MLPQQWAPPCGGQCTHKYSSLTQIPWRVFCKKVCDADGDTWEECLEECEEICYKEPVVKDRLELPANLRIEVSDWKLQAGNNHCSLFLQALTSLALQLIDDVLSSKEECFHACVACCGYKFEIDSKKVDEVRPNRPCKPPSTEKPPPAARAPPKDLEPGEPAEDVPYTSA